YLRVRVPLGQQGECSQLLRLECPERFPRAGDSLAPLRRVGGSILLRWDQLDPVRLLFRSRGWVAEASLAGPADRQRLVLGDRLHPADQLALVRGRRFVEQDLQGPLKRVLGVVGAERVAARGPPQ